MKIIYFLMSAILIIGCRVSKSDTSSSSDLKINEIVEQDSSLIEASRYYYTKYFDDMVKHSIEHGFNHRDKFGSASSYMIIKSTHSLALNGDTIAKMKLLDFVHSLAESKREYKVDESISVLLDFSIDLFEKKHFIAAIEFLNPKHLNSTYDQGSDTGSGDYTSKIFSKLLRLLTKEDRDYYYGRFNALFSKALEGNQNLASNTVWGEFYIYLKDELSSNRIDFVIK